MANPLPDTWNNRDLPVLREVVQRFEVEDGFVRVDVREIAAATGLTVQEVQRAGRNLERDRLVEVDGFAEAPVMWFTNFSSEALRLTGAWPTPETALDRMVAALQRSPTTQTTPTLVAAHAGSSTASATLAAPSPLASPPPPSLANSRASSQASTHGTCCLRDWSEVRRTVSTKVSTLGAQHIEGIRTVRLEESKTAARQALFDAVRAGVEEATSADLYVGDLARSWLIWRWPTA